MPQSEGIQEMANQAATQAVTAVMMALRHMDVGPWLAPTVSPRHIEAEAWQTSPRKALGQLECTGEVCWITKIWDGSHKHSWNKAYQLNDEEKVPVIKI